MNKPILVLKGLRKSFGGVAAVDRVSFEVYAREILAVIGPNGAGKTTLFNLITGALPADEGDVLLHDRPLRGLPTHEVSKLGVVRTFQNVQLFANMSVLENVMVGRHTRTRAGFFGAAFATPKARAEDRRTADRAMEILSSMGLTDRAGQPAAAIPFGQQRLLALARALAAEPEILLLDEPGAGLNASESAGLANLILNLRQTGLTILLVEHDMDLVSATADRVIVLDHGVVVTEGPPTVVQEDTRVVAAYLGGDWRA